MRLDGCQREAAVLPELPISRLELPLPSVTVHMPQVIGSSAQTVPVNITQFSVTSPTITYGQNQSYGAVVTSNPLFPGPFLWQNGTQTIATLSSLSNATSEGVFLGGAVRLRPGVLLHTMLQPSASSSAGYMWHALECVDLGT